MKRIIHSLLLAVVIMLPLGLAGQNQGFKLPGKKQSTTKPANSNKPSAIKSNGSKKNNSTKSAGSSANSKSNSSHKKLQQAYVDQELVKSLQEIINILTGLKDAKKNPDKTGKRDKAVRSLQGLRNKVNKYGLGDDLAWCVNELDKPITIENPDDRSRGQYGLIISKLEKIRDKVKQGEPQESRANSSSMSSHNSLQSRKEEQQRQRELEAQREIPQVIQNLIANMVYVEGGTFTMGGTSEQGSDAYNDEKPTHQVTLSSFSIGKYEVTQAEWQAVMGSNPSRFTGDSRRPVENVSWNDCQEFIRKLNAMTGKRFCLPTEAEWEYAARGGNRSRGYKYAGSDYIINVAWNTDNSCSTTHPVGTKSPNELGLYDMSGNVWEWCQDWCGSYSSNSQYNPIGPASGSSRVCRGGSWCNGARRCRVSNRFNYAPGNCHSYLGLRLVL